MPWCRLALSGGFASGFHQALLELQIPLQRRDVLPQSPHPTPPTQHLTPALLTQPSCLLLPEPPFCPVPAHRRLCPPTPCSRHPCCPLLPSSCDEASSSQGRMGRRGWAPSSQPRGWQQGRGTWRTPPHLQATGLHATHSWVPQTRFVATAASLVLKLDTQSAGGYSQHGELEVTQLELVRAPRCRDRHTRIAKRKKNKT